MKETDRLRRRFIASGAGAIAAAGLSSLVRTASARDANPEPPIVTGQPKVEAPPEKRPRKAMIGFSHLGICVSDLDRSVRFYTQALGAEELVLYPLDDVMPKNYRSWMGIPADTAGFSKFVGLDGFLIELLYYTRGGAPGGHVGPAERRPMNQLGFTHLSLRISDVAEYKATQDRIRKFGGHIVKNGHLVAEEFEGEPIELLFVTDPDGTRIELMRMPESYPMAGTIYRPRKLERT